MGWSVGTAQERPEALRQDADDLIKTTVFITAGHDRWLRRIKAEASVEDRADLSASAVVRLALTRLMGELPGHRQVRGQLQPAQKRPEGGRPRH